MNRVRAIFLEPLWGFVFSILPWLLLLPLFLNKTAGSDFIINCLDIKLEIKGYVNYLLSASFLSLLGIVLMRLINELNLLIKENYLIGLMIAIIGSIILNYNGFTTSCLATLFFALGIFWLCKSPKEGNLNKYVFNAGIFLFLPVFLDVKFLIITPLSLMLLFFLRTFSFRIILVFISTFALITFVLQQLHYLVTDDFFSMSELFHSNPSLKPGLTENQTYVLLALLLFQLILALESFSHLFISLSNKLKSVNRIFFYSFIILSMLVIAEKLNVGNVIRTVYLLPSLSLIITLNIMFSRNKWLMRVNFLGVICSLVFFFFKIV